jgi:hypothetical protein
LPGCWVPTRTMRRFSAAIGDMLAGSLMLQW